MDLRRTFQIEETLFFIGEGGGDEYFLNMGQNKGRVTLRKMEMLKKEDFSNRVHT